jgi:hypothetical protein
MEFLTLVERRVGAVTQRHDDQRAGSGRGSISPWMRAAQYAPIVSI